MGAAQVGAVQAGVTQPGLVQVGPAQVGSWELGAGQAGEVEIGGDQVLPAGCELAGWLSDQVTGGHGLPAPPSGPRRSVPIAVRHRRPIRSRRVVPYGRQVIPPAGCASDWATGLGSPASLWSSNEPRAGATRPPVCSSGDHAVGVDDVLAGRALVEVLVALGGLVERDHGRIHVLGDLHLVVQDGHHQLAVVLHHRALTGLERVRLGPAEPDPDRQRPDLGRLVDRARVAGDVQPGDAEPPGRPGDVHDGVEHGRRGLALGALLAVAAGLEADAVDGRVDLAGAAQDLLQGTADIVGLRQVDGLAAEAGRLGQPVGVQVADDDHGRAQQMRRGGTGQPDRAGPGDIDRRAGGHPGRHRAVVAGREDFRQHGQVLDLGHGLVAVGELEQVPVGVGDGHVLGLAAQPAAHVDIAVGGPGPCRVDVLTHAGVALLAVTAAPTGDVERHADQVTLLDELDVPADLGHLAGDLVAQGLALGGGGPPPDHVLVGAADVGGDDLEDDAVLQLTVVLLGELQLGEVEVLDLDLTGSGVDDAFVGIGHRGSLHWTGCAVRRLVLGPARGWGRAAESVGTAEIPVRRAGWLVSGRRSRAGWWGR